MARMISFSAALAGLATLLGSATAATTCNPLNVTAACPPIPGLNQNDYFMDFTKQTTTPSDWILADYATVNYGAPNGANFTFAKRYDAPYIWSRFYVHFGSIEVKLKVAPGAGVITAAVMMSDDMDEIDWEFSGNNFARSGGWGQTNYFSQGQIGWGDRGTTNAVDAPQDKFHTYTMDWLPESLTWSIDGVPVRTLKNNGAISGSYMYPQTPSRLHLGVWDAGDPSNAGGTIAWGGGLTNFSAAPYSAFVQSVKISNYNVCGSFQYPYPFDGQRLSVRCLTQTVTLPCTYAVAAGDDGYKIAKNLTVNVDTLKQVNPGVNWDQLLVGQVLNVPGGTCANSSTTTSMPATTSIVSSTTAMSTTSSAFSLHSSSSQSKNARTSSSSMSPSTTSKSTSSMSSSSSSMYSWLTPWENTTDSGISNTSSTTSSLSAAGTTSARPATTTSMPFSSSTATPITSTTTSALSTFTSNTTTSLNSSGTSGASSGSSTTTSSAPAQSYTVVAGDFGWSIASKNGCSFDALNAANPGIDWDKLQIGQTINVPAQSPSTSTSASRIISSSTVLTGSGSTTQSFMSSTTSLLPGCSADGSCGWDKYTTASTSTTATSFGGLPYGGQSGSSILSSSSGLPYGGLPSSSSSLPTSSSTTNSGTVSITPLSSSSTASTDTGSPSLLPPNTSSSSLSTSASTSDSGNAGMSSSGTPTATSSSITAPVSSSSASTIATDSGLNVASNTATTTSSMVASSTTSTASAAPGTSTATPASSPIVGTSAPTSSAATTGSVTTSSSSTNAVHPVTTSAKMFCNQDNCLRNVIDPRYSTSMRDFCSKYTTTTSNTMPLPTFLSGCSADVRRVSSACSCLITSFGTGTATASSKAATPSAFRSGAPSGKQVPSWMLKRSPLLRWN